MEKIVDWIKQHPAWLIGGIIVAGVGLYLLFTSSGSNSASAAQPDDTAAELSYQENSDNLAAAASAQGSTQSYNLTANAQAIQGQLALQQETDQTTLAEQGTAAAVTTAANQQQYQLGLSTIGAQLAGLLSNNSTTVDVAQIAANENTTIAQTNANVSITNANDLEQLGVVESNNNVAVAKAQASAQTNAGIFGLLGAIF